MVNYKNPLRILNPGGGRSNLPPFQNTSKAPPLLLIMMRINIKIALICVCAAVLLITLSLWTRCGVIVPTIKIPLPEVEKAVDNQDVQEIDCHINGEFTIGCRKEGDEVYVPFSFLHKYFEIYGKLATYDGLERFEWSHSYSKVNHPKGKYDPRGVFMYFDKYNVEVRDRVKCISAIEGVPVSTQWESQGYFYPTQIAQFGLSHYSKNLTEPEPRRKIIEDGNENTADWEAPIGSTVSRVVDGNTGKKVFKFSMADQVSGWISLRMDHALDFVLSAHICLEGNGTLTIVLGEKRDVFYLHYTTSDVMIWTQGSHVYHGVGVGSVCVELTRDLAVDLQKGLGRRISRGRLRVLGIRLQGSGRLNNLSLATSEHMAQFYAAARWLVKHQSSITGGWPNPVKRRVAAGFAELEPGWLSAMGQGHGVSLLARAYHRSGDIKYLRAAAAALRPFRVPGWQGGVLATFLGKYAWYEEYPTRPASFVLNGFIYSLLGLYDLQSIAPASETREASLLFEQGLTSLKGMLLLFDMGSGTSYDLRHFTLGVAPNLARWDYHATHVNQLLLLATIDMDPLIQTTAERWIGYMSGKRAAHN